MSESSSAEPTHFVHHVADNADHNSRTLDGRNTFHGMGIICSVTPAVSLSLTMPRLEDVSTKDLIRLTKIEQKVLPSSRKPLTLKFTELNKPANAFDSLSFAWAATWLLNLQQPFRSGYMQTVNTGNHPGRASIFFMPMIDLKSTDPVCILSTMHFVAEQSSKYNLTPVLTFDQPLYWKSMSIKEQQDESSALKNIVLRIGGFPQMMRFLGSIGYTMQGSGLQALFQLIYAEESVNAMLNGKDISRATRAHTLIYAVLYGYLTAKLFECNLGQPSNDGKFTINSSLQTVKELVKGTPENTILCTMEAHIITTLLNQLLVFFNSTKSKTATLWIQYMKMVEICLQFLKAEHNGDWQLHLDMSHMMLPYFTASGHYHYQKSVYLYFQTMSQIHVTHPSLHKHFMNGLHVIRRSDRFWAGLSPDLVIEQILMRSLKTSAGLTRGRGMSERQRAIWLLSMPVTAEVNRAMQDFTGTKYQTSDQHKDTAQERIARDHSDGLKILQYLQERDPFTAEENLINLSTGEVADESVNVHQAFEIGEKLICGMKIS